MLKRYFLALLFVFAPFAAQAGDSYTIDGAHTFPHFMINHVGFSTMHGRFDETSGKITLDPHSKSGGSVDITIQTGSISTGFGKRDEDLKAPDFFDVAEFPTMTFQSTRLHFKGKELTEVDGKLTLRGVTKPVKLTVTHFHCGMFPFDHKEKCGADAHAEFKRSEFGMKKDLPAIGDDVKMVFEIEAYKD